MTPPPRPRVSVTDLPMPRAPRSVRSDADRSSKPLEITAVAPGKAGSPTLGRQLECRRAVSRGLMCQRPEYKRVKNLRPGRLIPADDPGIWLGPDNSPELGACLSIPHTLLVGARI